MREDREFIVPAHLVAHLKMPPLPISPPDAPTVAAIQEVDAAMLQWGPSPSTAKAWQIVVEYFKSNGVKLLAPYPIGTPITLSPDDTLSFCWDEMPRPCTWCGNIEKPDRLLTRRDRDTNQEYPMGYYCAACYQKWLTWR
jgi:hypothetical protein